jgi:transposase InsO family protein
MPWKECSIMDQRLEFVLLASHAEANISRLAERFGISRTAAYKWLARYRSGGYEALADKSRRPHHSPICTPVVMEQAIWEVRDSNPAWGGRKIRRRLQDMRSAGLLKHLAGLNIPAAATITEVLRRHGRLNRQLCERATKARSFEYAKPNDLWQMDFKGDVVLSDRTTSYPLTILDDHSRFNVCLKCCTDCKRQTVQQELTLVFRRYGLPLSMLMDNGVPWGGSHSSLTRLALWLLRLGIRVLHGRPHHPQTQGKEERFHRTLKAEVLNNRLFGNLQRLQKALDSWRIVYNHQRPHEALGMETPSCRYSISPRQFPDTLAPVSYDDGAVTRKVSTGKTLSFERRIFLVAKALAGETVALRPTIRDGVHWICYGSFAIGEIDLTDVPPGGYGRARIFPSARYARFGEYPCQELLTQVK